MADAKFKCRSLTAKRLRELLDYNHETGVFTRRSRNAQHAVAGAVAGSRHRLGYLTISVAGTTNLAHRLAWLYMFGEWPTDGLDIDHINGVKHDNRISNLRLSTRSQNCCNRPMRSDNTTGYSNVYFDRSRLSYYAEVRAGGRKRRLCGFASPEAAYVAARELQIEFHGAFAKHLCRPDPS